LHGGILLAQRGRLVCANGAASNLVQIARTQGAPGRRGVRSRGWPPLPCAPWTPPRLPHGPRRPPRRQCRPEHRGGARGELRQVARLGLVTGPAFNQTSTRVRDRLSRLDALQHGRVLSLQRTRLLFLPRL
jgi:hypothetical protein